MVNTYEEEEEEEEGEDKDALAAWQAPPEVSDRGGGRALLAFPRLRRRRGRRRRGGRLRTTVREAVARDRRRGGHGCPLPCPTPAEEEGDASACDRRRQGRS